MNKPLFFIGICPPDRLERQVHRIKEEFHQKYGLKGAFRSTAHITLQMPFSLTEKKEISFIDEISTQFVSQKPFEIEILNFSKFEPRVIFLNIKENKDLNLLQLRIEKFMKRFQVFNSTHKNNGFNPHITVAFRDLKKPTFYKVWDEVKDRNFKESFIADEITIFKHNGASWDEYKKIKLGNS